jgi:O-methyltransferase involved in polyketide biosynthesis
MTVEREKLKLEDVQETLLLPLWGRAMENRKPQPLLKDPASVKIIDRIDYDFDVFSKNINPITRIAWIARSIYFDEKIRAFLSANPSGTVINAGCGLDTTFDRVDNGRAVWYEIDMPDVIELRRKFIEETGRRIFISGSILEEAWFHGIKLTGSVFVMMAGLIYYFQEEEVKKLFGEIEKHFPASELVFDYSSHRGVKVANKQLIEKSGLSDRSYLHWGIDNIYDIENWSRSIHVLENLCMFAQHRKRYPFYRRLGMYISDKLKVMSLAHIKIEKTSG